MVEFYVLSTSEFPLTQPTVWENNRQGGQDAITLTGSVYQASYRYNPAYNVSDTISLWDFGEVPAGSYTLHIPYVFFTTAEGAYRRFPVDLTTCTFSKEEIPLPYGSMAVRSCEPASGDAVPDWACDANGNAPFSSGWLITAEWLPPENADLIPTDLPINVVSGDGLGGQRTFRPDPAMQDGILTLFYGCSDGTEEDLAEAYFSVHSLMSLLWNHTFEIPITIESGQ